MKETLTINRQLAPGEYRLSELCGDIGTCEILQEVFPDAGEFQTMLAHTRVIVTDAPRPREMCVDNDDGSILIGLAHLRSAPEVFLHLDIIHELCHVKQHLQGRDLYDLSLAYVDRPTEIEAYAVTVREARRIGLTEDQIANYLRVSWITPEEYRRFLRCLAVAGDYQADCK